ncbi:type IV pilus biogenesis protein PilM [Paraburkholderia sartisoli]|uniref:Tfp pilus assembly protein, ATPase PilM n=1 Tax=Paraburkholderia sartisoli TaxID=83784 RepID=A0A1H4HL84_9BURK|nr:pilus assembly protein PilM [Paraburkholderia sartisoli]SEB22210.1 Tfp pilus assembly protein, ATPase PilM [Paraburkholderia sartisoli]
MALRNAWMPVVRRFAAGIDIGQQEIRLVVLSQRGGSGSPVRLEFIAVEPLFTGALAGAEIVNRAAVGTALRALVAQLPRDLSTHLFRCAMAMPASATMTTSVPMANLAASHRPFVGDHALAALEPAVMAEAERVAGIERHALAVDWFIDDSPQRSGCVTIAATTRTHLEARMECAAAAGITLTAIDGEPHAALRAMRHVASLELDESDAYVAIWVGDEGVHGWRVADESIVAEMRYPAPEHADLIEALRDLAGEGVRCAVLSGQVALLQGIGFTAADLGDVLGCMVLPFECVPPGDDTLPLRDDLLHEPAFAVAFGLALRGLME